MDTFTRDELRQLVEADGKWHVSIYLPTQRAGNEQQQNPIRFKNLLAQAEKKLLDYDVRRPEVDEMLRSAADLLADPMFWQHQSDGLAAFLSKDLSRIYRLSARFDEAVVVGKSFYVQPLLQLLNGNGNFYILSLSVNQRKLFKASKDMIHEVELKDTPKNMEEALMIEDKQKNLGFQTMTQNTVGGTGGERAASHYGQGVEDNKKEDILRYCQEVDNGIARLMDDESAPMVIAAVDYLIPIYRQASTYRNLLDEGVVGSPEQHNLKELHSLAWKVVEPIFTRSQQEAIDRFNELLGQQNGLATNDLDTAVKAAIGGRVETLLVPLGRQKWGHYDPASDSVKFDPEPTPENEDMINYAAVQTILSSGNVYALPADNFPGGGDIAAILRYVI
jgi:hypothetical protein